MYFKNRYAKQTGIIEEVNEEGGLRQIHCLPYHPVIHSDKSTTNLRVILLRLLV